MKNPLLIVAFIALAVFVVLWGWIGDPFQPVRTVLSRIAIVL